MTVSTTQSQTVALGNGVLTSFNFSFNNAVPTGQSVSEASYTVIYTSPTGVETTLASSTYTLAFTAAAAGSLWGNGGILTYPLTGSPIASGSTLTLIRTFPLTQTTTISNQGDFAPQVIEEMGDTLVMQIQQLNNRTTQWRGTWMSGVIYNPGDIVQDGASGAGTNNYYLCTVGNNSGTWSTDLGNGDWTLSVQALLPTSNNPITLSGAVTGTGSTLITTAFGTVAASSLLGNIGTATAVATAIPVSAGNLIGRSATATSAVANISLGTGLSMIGTTLTGGIVSVKRQAFTASATYTPSAGMLYCDMQMWGGGGGGGGVSAAAQAMGAGGGAGGYSRDVFSAATIGASQAIVIGAGGIAGTNAGGTGGTGGSTLINALITAAGGVGGTGSTTNTVSVAGGLGGAGTVGGVATAGAPGGAALFGGGVNGSISGQGGCTLLGGGGLAINSVSAANGNNGTANSGGGASGASAGAGTAKTGGVGGTGLAVVIEYCSQ